MDNFTDKFNQNPPGKVSVGERLKASTINTMIDAIGSPRTLSENPLPFKSVSVKPYSFQVIIDPTDSTRVAIRGGLWDITTIGITQTSQEISSSGNFTGNGPLPTHITTSNPSIISAGFYYVYLLWYGGVLGNITEGSRLDAYITSVDGDRPLENAGGYQATSIKVLARVVADPGGNIEIVQEWTGGNIKTKALVIDGGDPINRNYKSLEYNNDGNIEIDGFKEASDIGVTNMSKVLALDNRGAPNLVNWIYVNTGGLAGAGDALMDSLVVDVGGTSFDDVLLRWGRSDYTITNGISDMDDIGGDSLNLMTAFNAYWTKANAHFDIMHIQLSDMPDDTVSDHDDRYWRDFSVHNGTMNFDYITTGTVTAGNGFIVNATNSWNASVLAVDTSGAISLDSATTITLDAVGVISFDSVAAITFDAIGDVSVNNGTILKVLDTTVAGSGQGSINNLGGYVGQGGIYINAGAAPDAGNFSDGASAVLLCSGTYAIDASGQRINSMLGYVFNGNNGLTVNGHEGGILTSEEDFDSAVEAVAESVYQNLSTGGF